MNISFVFQVEPVTLDVETGYARLDRLIHALRPVLSAQGWFRCPRDPEESKQPWPAFADAEAFKIESKARMEAALEEWPENPNGFTALLYSVWDEASYKANKGRVRATLSFAPGRGRIQVEVLKPEEAWPDLDLVTWAKNIVRAVVMEEWVEFANTDVSQWPRIDGEKGADYFSQDYRTFPHRQFLGWMGFVQRLPPKVPITPEDLPQAAEVVPLPGRGGSLIVSVGETFDVHNPYHIRQAQQVEMRLVDLDALPVIDPDFMT